MASAMPESVLAPATIQHHLKQQHEPVVVKEGRKDTGLGSRAILPKGLGLEIERPGCVNHLQIELSTSAYLTRLLWKA